MDSHPLTFAVVEGAAVVFVDEECCIGAGVDGDRESIVDVLTRVLFDRAKGQQRSGTHVQRYRRKINWAADLTPSLDEIASPEVVPITTRKINAARGRCHLNYGCNQNVPAPQILVWASDGSWIIRIVQPQGAHHRHARGRAFAHCAV